ncbi:MAG TPA: hypothetical protein ENH62_15510 [Marinobacter sp.]|uniref:Uncharacterized protein n=2 Tax=root TaxID=1 RepID=A0A831VUX2_9GAMM|nr:hypothetical protein [Marinobacter antarcticus]HDZ39657.1 hypothetical protein [Marinobacter sp.]HEA51344.1 hypothetical protein [Marinobacter antarcticus]
MSTSHTATIVATVLAAVITAAVSLYIHFDSPEIDVRGTVTETVGADSEQEGSSTSPSMNIADVFIAPINTDMATNFFAEISNSGTETAKDFQLTINFGEATIEKCEVQPSSISRPTESKPLSVQSYNISTLGKDASIYISCAVDLPYFKKIWVGGGNIQYEKSLTYDAYKELKNGDDIGFYEGLLRAVILFFLAMAGFKIVGFLFD